MVLVQIYNVFTSKQLIESASKLSKELGKDFGILYNNETEKADSETENELKQLLHEQNISDCKLFSRNYKTIVFSEFCDEADVSFLFIQLIENKSKAIRYNLNRCRDLRIPYVLYKDSFPALNLEKVLLPINFLEEEVEKAQFASAFGRFCKSEVNMLLANDYGSKAAKNAERMKQLFDKFDFVYTLEKAEKDSFKVEMEAVNISETKQTGLIIVSASRDYGLDDILFGPKESHVVKKSTVPVLLVNPRGDLYALCD